MVDVLASAIEVNPRNTEAETRAVMRLIRQEPKIDRELLIAMLGLEGKPVVVHK